MTMLKLKLDLIMMSNPILSMKEAIKMKMKMKTLK